MKRGFTVGPQDCGLEIVNLDQKKRESLLKQGIQVSQIGERLSTRADSQKREQEIVTAAQTIVII